MTKTHDLLLFKYKQRLRAFIPKLKNFTRVCAMSKFWQTLSSRTLLKFFNCLKENMERIVNTKIWSDIYVLDLDPTEKLLWVYLLTNSKTNISGIYEINPKIIAFETGIDKDMILKILDRFREDKKVSYHKDYIIIINWIKHQNVRNIKIQKGIARILNEETPDSIKNYIYSNTTLHKKLIEDVTRYNLINNYE